MTFTHDVLSLAETKSCEMWGEPQFIDAEIESTSRYHVQVLSATGHPEYIYLSAFNNTYTTASFILKFGPY